MKGLTLITLALFALVACGDKDAAASEIPAAVKTAFQTAYPGATDVEWELEGDEIEVEWEMNGEEYEASYNRMGKLLDSDYGINMTIDELPVTVQQAVNTSFPGYVMDDVQQVTVKGEQQFEIEMNSRTGDRKKATFTAAGQLVSSEDE